MTTREADDARFEQLTREALARLPVDEPCPEIERLMQLVESPQGDEAATGLQRHVSACLPCALELEALERDDTWREATALHRLGRAINQVAARLAELARVEPAACVVPEWRGPGGADAEFRDAMEPYHEGRYAAARDRLAAAAGPQAPPELWFYLGVSQLVTGRFESALDSLQRATRAKPSLGEYRWYHAHALLATGDREGACAALRACARRSGPYRDTAARKVRQIEDWLQET